MSLVGPPSTTPGIAERLVVVGYGNLSEDRALAGIIVETLIDTLGFWCYVFEADDVTAWQEAPSDDARFDLAAIINVGSFKTLSQWLQGSARRFFGTSFVNIGSDVGPPLALTVPNRNDVLSIYRQDQLHELVPWANSLGSRHTGKVIMEATHSFAGFYIKVAKRIVEYLSPREEQARFHKATRYVANVDRSKTIPGVKGARDAGGYEPVEAGVLYRSGDLVGISEKGKAKLRALGIQLIFDLRPEKYRKQRAIVIEGIPVATVNAPRRALIPTVMAMNNRQPVLVFGMKANDADVQFVCSEVLRRQGVPPTIIEMDARL